MREKYGGQFTLRLEEPRGGVQPVEMADTSFWPDMTVGSDAHSTLVAVEVKCLTQKGRPGQVASAIGQALIYRELYEHSLILMVDLDDLDIAFPDSLAEKLADNDIDFVLIQIV